MKKFIIRLSLIMLCILSIWFCVVFVYALEYENSNALTKVEEYFSNLDKDLDNKMSLHNYEIDEINTKDHFIEYHNSLYSDIDKLVIYEIPNAEDDLKVYAVYDNDDFITNFYLRKTKNSRLFNIEYYEIEKIDLNVLEKPIIKTTKLIKVLIDSKEINNPMGSEYVKSFESLKEEDITPKLYIKKINDYILYEPDFKYEVLGNYDVKIDKVDDNTWEFFTIPKTKDEDYYYSLTKDVAYNYVKYLTNDISIGDFRNKLYRNTEFFQIFNTYVNKWFSYHESYRFEDLNQGNTIIYDNSSFTSDISFTHVIISYGVEYKKDVSYRVSFKKINGKWLCVNIEIL